MISSTHGHISPERRFHHGCEGSLCGLVAIILAFKDDADAGAYMDADDADNGAHVYWALPMSHGMCGAYQLYYDT